MLLTLINFCLITFHFSLNYINFLFLLNFSFILFCIGFLGSIYNKQNLLILLLCIELMLLSVGLNFSYLSLITNKLGQIFMLFIMTIAAGESSIGLGLLILLYRIKKTINFQKFLYLKN
jgi:NADH-quinone oxidoreductase subunit K